VVESETLQEQRHFNYLFKQKIYMKQALLSIMLIATTLTLRAQDDKSDEEYELRGSEKYGYIITEKDEKIEGIVRLMGTAQTPWVNQKKVKFIAKDKIDPERKRQKLKVWDTDDLKEYVAYEEAGERHFRLIKYTNTREGLGTDNSGAGGTFKAIKNLSTTRHIAEVVVNGKISVFRLYGYPAAFAVGEADVKKMEAETKDLIENPTILYQKEDSKIKALKSDDIKELVKDCDMVKEKLVAGGYPSYDPAKEEKKRSGMGKLIRDEADRVSDRVLNMGREVFGDYNANCK
jgi:hypothetical protein